MARGKKHNAEQVVNLLRQIEVAVANGKTTPQACRKRESWSRALLIRVADFSGFYGPPRFYRELREIGLSTDESFALEY